MALKIAQVRPLKNHPNERPNTKFWRHALPNLKHLIGFPKVLIFSHTRNNETEKQLTGCL